MSPEYRISGNYWLNKAAEENKQFINKRFISDEPVLKFRGKFREASSINWNIMYNAFDFKVSMEEFEKSKEV